MHSFKPAKAELSTVNKGACEECSDIDLLACSSFKDRQSTLSTNNMTLHRYLDSRPFVSWQQDHDHLDVMRKRKKRLSRRKFVKYSVTGNEARSERLEKFSFQSAIKRAQIISSLQHLMPEHKNRAIEQSTSSPIYQ
jgi:hypothetical protein